MLKIVTDSMFLISPLDMPGRSLKTKDRLTLISGRCNLCNLLLYMDMSIYFCLRKIRQEIL